MGSGLNKSGTSTNQTNQQTTTQTEVKNEEFWIAGSVPSGTNGTPPRGPFREETVPPQPPKNRIMTSDSEIPKTVSADWKWISQFGGLTPIYARAFFPHCLPCYCVGWSKLELSPEHPHYNCKKHREREKEKERLGVPIDYSRRKKYFIYPERVSEIGLFLFVDGKRIETNCAISNSTWGAEPIPSAFFTFSPDPNSVFGENSLQIPLRPVLEDAALSDKRWLKLGIEFDKVLQKLQPGNHEFKCELKYRYGNTKFTAWRGVEGDKGVYRYSDEDRVETCISEAVAAGTFSMKLSSEDLKIIKKHQEDLEAKTSDTPPNTSSTNLSLSTA